MKINPRIWLAAALLLWARTVAATPDYPAVAGAYQREHPGKGKFGEYWQPIDVQRYWNPKDFYQPPKTIAGEFTREQCVECHQAVTAGFYNAWKKSTHANLEEIRKIQSPDHPKFYKKALLARVEENLRKQGILAPGAGLTEVGCIDCHGSQVGAQNMRHDQDLVLPDRSRCGSCHVDQFAEAESEKQQEWPQGQWPKGHPSHAVDWKANVETAIWAGMAEREIAQGCDMCHYQQNKCDGCHTRHSFSAAEARQPEACATCHNGVDHNEWENYQLSKHGTVYQTHKSQWNFEVPLKDALTTGGYTAPTCQLCHFEFNGDYSHNLVRKVRWGFNPTPAIADNLSRPWFEGRKKAWQATCSNCHSGRFAESYLTAADKGTISGLKVEQEAKRVVEDLFKDGLLPGQRGNRPQPPAPEKDTAGGFFQLFWARDNNPSHVERVYADLWEHDLIKLYKGLFHANPGGFTYTEGWSPLMRDYAMIMDENSKLREKPGKVGVLEQAGAKISAALPENDAARLILGGVAISAGIVLVRRKSR
jgi:hydroxylamine dehydrogenase